MRKATLGMGMAVFAGMALAACGDQPEPLAPVEPAYESTTESTDTDQPDGMLPDTTLPEGDTLPPTVTEPGEMPEVVVEGDTFAPEEPRTDAAEDMMEDTETAEDPM